MFLYEKYLKIPRISPESNVEIDVNKFKNSTFKFIIEKWTTLYIIKAQNTPDLTQNI